MQSQHATCTAGVNSDTHEPCPMTVNPVFIQRDNVVRSFRLGQIWVLICTELMGRGIDFMGVNLVINYDFPNSAVSYIHRIGRPAHSCQPRTSHTCKTCEKNCNDVKKTLSRIAYGLLWQRAITGAVSSTSLHYHRCLRPPELY